MTNPLFIPADLRLLAVLERRWPLSRRERHLQYAERLIVLLLLLTLVLKWTSGVGWADILAGLSLLIFVGWLVIYALIIFSRYQLARLWSGAHPSWSGTWAAWQVLAGGPADLLAAWEGTMLSAALKRSLGLPASIITADESIDKVTKLTGEESAAEVVKIILTVYPKYADYFRQAGVADDDVVAAATWAESRARADFWAQAWWRWEHLATIPGLAKDWHYGETVRLEEFGHFIELVDSAGLLAEELAAIERVLNRAREANVVVVGEAGAPLSVAAALAAKIKSGTVWSHLEGKRLFCLETGRLLSAYEHQAGLSEKLLSLAAVAVAAGNIILVIDDLPRLAAYLARLGTPLSTLLDAHLAGAALTVIGLSDKSSFHAVLEPDAVLMNRFEVVTVAAPALPQIINLLTTRLRPIEMKTKLFFTYQAVKAMAQSLSHYFSAGAPDSEADDLLAELVPTLMAKEVTIVKRDEVLTFVREKTKIPVGEVRPDERAELLNLEARLKERVIGQERALSLLANAVRRSRAATRNESRPIGNFLFLGPTGVGKTETAKALAQILFGREEALMRLDMSEYANIEALPRLIGSLTTGTPGILAKMVREQPYGVLLLDEFEKTHPEVQNLFLRIFDEGVFSDYEGRMVNLRSLIIIATSNAGADLIWDWLKTKANLAGEEARLVDELVKRGLFKPELLNRFDATVIYEPLSPDSLKKIARLQLGRLNKRLNEQGIRLLVDDRLVEAVAANGANRQFGARPMQRLIQETVEEAVARAVIKGELSAGREAEFIPTRSEEANLLGLQLHVK